MRSIVDFDCAPTSIAINRVRIDPTAFSKRVAHLTHELSSCGTNGLGLDDTCHALIGEFKSRSCPTISAA